MSTCRISKATILSLPSQHYATTQVPSAHLLVRRDGTVEEPGVIEEYPATFFCWITGYRPVVGKEQGFLHLTRAGWAQFKPDIRRVYEESSGQRAGTWADFEKETQQHFADIEDGKRKKIKELREKLRQLEEAEV